MEKWPEEVSFGKWRSVQGAGEVPGQLEEPGESLLLWKHWPETNQVKPHGTHENKLPSGVQED